MAVAYHTDGKSYHWRGKETIKIPMKLYEDNRERVCQRLRGNLRTPANSYIILEGGKPQPFYNSDVHYVFQQEPYFMWTFGIQLPNLYGIIEVKTGDTYLFIPKHSDKEIPWMGRLSEPNDFKFAYHLKNVLYQMHLEKFLDNLDHPVLLTLNGTNSDSGEPIPTIMNPNLSTYVVKNNLLYREITECRVKKSSYELEIFRYLAEVTSTAHRRVMKLVTPGMMEYQCEAEFLRNIYYYGGCRHAPYPPACASGPNTAILNYGHENAPNDREIQNGDLCLFDMGASYFGYLCDITTTFPANGTFSRQQRAIYNAVWECRKATLTILKPGQSMATIHILAMTTLLYCLKEVGILNGNIDPMLKAGVDIVFHPHGLAHFVGLDTHDVGGYLDGHPARSKCKSLERLRTARVLDEGMLLTLEPGCYFIDSLITEALLDPCMKGYFNRDVIASFKGFGGVRIKDMVYITRDGCEVLSNVPRTVEEIETYMRSTLDMSDVGAVEIFDDIVKKPVKIKVEAPPTNIYPTKSGITI